MNSLRQAAYLNNHGISLLLQRDHERASECFSKSVRIVRGMIEEAPHAADEEERSWNVSIQAVGLEDDSEGQLYVYGNAFHIVLDGGQSEQTSNLMSNRDLSALVIFNMALLFHSKALSGYRESSSQAIQLYELSMKILKTTGAASVVRPALRAFALNNMGVLLHLQSQDQAASTCFLGLIHILQATDSDMAGDSREGILSNCVFVLVQENLGNHTCARAA